jgi:mannose-6-phosphate isomerase-like protein (cupin superfamily)
MTVHNLLNITGTEFPAGRRTRVLAGPGAPVEPNGFVLGHVTIYPGGEVPLHDHGQEEVYLIVSGRGVLALGDEDHPVKPGDYVYIKPGTPHNLRNTSAEDMVMVFCYAPKSIVDHWQQELQEGEGPK